jgi:uncharacterized protein (DUF427 family)
MSSSPRIQTQLCPKPLCVYAEGLLLASTHQAIMLLERNYPVRYYIPRTDVDMAQLSVSQTRTVCPHKGQATYYSWQHLKDVAWSYEAPLPDLADISGALCFAQDAWLTWPEGGPDLT